MSFVVFECCFVEFMDGVQFSFKVSWARFRRFVAGVGVVSAKVPAFVTVFPGVRRVGSFIGLFRIWDWVNIIRSSPPRVGVPLIEPKLPS